MPLPEILILTAIVATLLGVALFALSRWPRLRRSPTPLLDAEGHRRADPPINLRLLDQAVARGE